MTTLTLYIAATADDAGELGDTLLQLSGRDTDGIILGHRNGEGICDAAFRFTNVTVPSGATIVSAHVEPFLKYLIAGNLYFIQKGIAEDSTAAWSASDRPSMRAKTTASVSTTYTASDYVDETYKVFPDITDIIQEIIDRPGWASGNALAIVMEDNGSAGDASWQLQDVGRDATKPAKLVIEYTAGGGTTGLYHYMNNQ